MEASDYTADQNRYNGLMKYRRCGKSGVLLPAVSLGMWYNFGGVNDYGNSKKMVHFAFDKGITHFDLANNYGPPYGSAEETFGKIMTESLKAYRSELFISTKAGHDMWPGPYGEWGSRKYLMNSLDQSLKRMNLDYVDIFYSHRFDPHTPVEETMQAIVDIVRQGKALYAGISKYPVDAAQTAYEYLKSHDVPCLLYQGRYNLFHREDEAKGILKQAGENGTGYIAYSPLAQGLLSDRYLAGNVPADSRMSRNYFLRREDLTPAVVDRLRKLNSLAAKRGQTLAQMSLAWLLKDDLVTSVIIGASSVEQLGQNLNTVKNLEFSKQELGEIELILTDD